MRRVLKPFTILIVKYLQKRYKKITIDNRHNQTNQVIAKLTLIQSILYFFKTQFSAWGYFHKDCVWTYEDGVKFREIFPDKDEFEEIDTVVHHNPEAVTYYHNKIYELTDHKPPCYEIEIKEQLLKWKDWN